MRILMHPIEMVAWFTQEGKPHPVRYRLHLEGQDTTVVRVDKIIRMEEEKLAGNRMLVFRCQSVLHGEEKVYELKYELSTCKWFLYKI